MLISIEPLAEEELDAFARVAQSAFVDGIGSVLLHGGAAADASTHANLAKGQGNYFRNDLSTRYFKAIDTSTGDIVAVAKWNFYLREQTAKELDCSLHIPSPGAVDYVASIVPILKHLMGERRQFMGGKPYIYLCMLATDPKYHRCGAGAKLVEWGVNQADELGLEMYLESSPEAKLLYERWGFKVLKEVKFDMNQFGRPDLKDMVDVNTVMIRQPKGRP